MLKETKDKLENILPLALSTKRDIVMLKKKYLEPVEEEHDVYKSTLKSILQAEGETEFSIDGQGKVHLFERKNPKKFDEEKLKQALGVTNLADYLLPDTTSTIVQITDLSE